MISQKARQHIAGAGMTGYFWPAGTDLETTAVLRWTPSGGAVLELIGGPVWPRELGGPPFVVHGINTDGDPVTLLDAWVKRASFTRPVVLHSGTLALGAQIDGERRWPRVIYSTANLSEWRADTGLKFSYPNRRKRPRHIRMDWQPPTNDEVE